MKTQVSFTLIISVVKATKVVVLFKTLTNCQNSDANPNFSKHSAFMKAASEGCIGLQLQSQNLSCQFWHATKEGHLDCTVTSIKKPTKKASTDEILQGLAALQRKQLIQGSSSSIHFSLLFGNALLQGWRQILHGRAEQSAVQCNDGKKGCCLCMLRISKLACISEISLGWFAAINSAVHELKGKLIYATSSKHVSEAETDRHVSFITIGKKAGFLSRR